MEHKERRLICKEVIIMDSGLKTGEEDRYSQEVAHVNKIREESEAVMISRKC